jgi:hypothetical protein
MKLKYGWLLFIMALLCLGSTAEMTLAQALPTATPDADGVIYVVVQPNDNLWTIAVRHDLSLQELLALNDLNENALIRPGDRLIVGHGPPPATATVPLPATPTLPPPTPTFTPAPPPTAICLLAFVDVTGNGRFDPGDPLQEAVAFTIFNEATVVANYITDGFSEPYCIEGLSPGDYNVTRSLRSDEQATTPGDMAIALRWGDRVELAFGAVSRDNVAGEEETAVPAALTATVTPSLNETAAVNPATADGVAERWVANQWWANQWLAQGRTPWVWWLAACGLMALAGLLILGLAAYLYLTRVKD